MLSGLLSAFLWPPIPLSCYPGYVLFLFMLFGCFLRLLGCTSVSSVFGAARAGAPVLSAEDFDELGCKMMGFNKKGKKARKRRFMAHFGLDPRMVSIVWQHLAASGWLHFAGVRGAKPEHFLWCLHWFKCYDTEEICAACFGCDEKMFQKWVWFYAEGIANLSSSVVSFRNDLAVFLFCSLVLLISCCFFLQFSHLYS